MGGEGVGDTYLVEVGGGGLLGWVGLSVWAGLSVIP